MSKKVRRCHLKAPGTFEDFKRSRRTMMMSLTAAFLGRQKIHHPFEKTSDFFVPGFPLFSLFRSSAAGQNLRKTKNEASQDTGRQ